MSLGNVDVHEARRGVEAFIEGFLTSAGLIIAIGAQNAFVLKQGLMRNQVFITALFCFVIDSFFIALGVGGFGFLVASNQILLSIAKWGGATFLFWYGIRSFRAVFRSESLRIDKSRSKPGLKETLIILSAVSFLNPHVYLDTVFLIGSIGSQFDISERPYFAFGAILASLIWFFSLAYGARLLAPLFQKPKAWQVLDFIIGCIMWAIAASLLLHI